MVAISEVKSQLAKGKRFGPGLVGVFVGGTSGIGEGTAREFVRYTTSPRVYLIGRNQDAADRLTKEFTGINKEAQVSFIKKDVSLVRNVDEVCEELKGKENKINLLVLSPGMLSMKARDESTEGLDKKFALHYYSRLRCTQNLLPLLENAAKSASAEGSRPLATVLSVLSGGMEGAINVADLSLKTNYSLMNCAKHAITMTTLTFSTLAEQHPSVAFIHTQPGGVNTNISRGLPGIVQKAMWLLKPLTQSVQESGERHAYAAMNDNWGRGLHLVGSNSTETDNSKMLQKLKDDGTQDKVWNHTEEVFEKIAKEGKY